MQIKHLFHTFVLFGSTSALADSSHADLRFEVTGLDSNAGSVLCTLYVEANWLSDEEHVATAMAKPANGRAMCVFAGVAPGTYGVFFMHDANGNNDMDKSWLGLPKERWGVSRDAPVMFGPPSFKRAHFEHPASGPQTAALR